VTHNPATLLGLGNQIGLVEVGFDADLVIWNRHPLELGAHPLKVFVDGHETFSHSLAGGAFDKQQTRKEKVKVEVTDDEEQSFSDLKDYALVNISTVYLSLLNFYTLDIR
jgi:adenine deaminase